ncbi:MAG: PEGA domain-containing protein [Lentisphaeria bacterium]|nr:PEGA domain-containing protein [Lentisphaeria bacterium]
MNKSVLMRFFFAAAVVFLLLPTVSCKKKAVIQKPVIAIDTIPEKADIEIIGYDIFTPAPVSFRLPPGSYIVKVSKEKYEPLWQKIEVKQGNNQKIKFELAPETSSVMIVTEPEQATVRFQGKELGSTPVVIRDLPHGEYTAEIYRHGYTRKTVSWKIDSSVPKLVKTDITSNQGTLNITTIPDHVDIYVNNKKTGITPFKEQLEEGRHTIEFRKEGYLPLTRIVQIKRGETTFLRKQILEVKPGNIRISSRPSGAKILIGNKHYGDTPLKLENLTPGIYTIRLEKTGFDPAVRTLNLPAGGNLDITMNLDSNTGGVDIVTQPSGVTLYLDGKMIGITEPDKTNPGTSKIFKVKNLSIGSHVLKITHKRGRPNSKVVKFNVNKGETVRLNNLSLWIPNAIITRKDGNTETGKIIQTLSDSYLFEPQPGVKYTIRKSQISEVKFLKIVE